jgi:hypothetical protein
MKTRGLVTVFPHQRQRHPIVSNARAHGSSPLPPVELMLVLPLPSCCCSLLYEEGVLPVIKSRNMLEK